MTRLLRALALVTLVAAGSAALSAQSIAGDWTLTINGPQGIIDSDASFTVEGDQVTGTMTGPMGESPVSGTVSGTALSLAFSVASSQGPIDIKMTADVAGDEMKGVLDFGMGTADFTGKKK